MRNSGEFTSGVVENLRNPGIYQDLDSEAYHSVQDIINFERIREREQRFHHDVFARLHEFNFMKNFYVFVRKIIIEWEIQDATR